jgi:hypothetical protein
VKHDHFVKTGSGQMQSFDKNVSAGGDDGIAGVSLSEFKRVIGAVAANDWLEHTDERSGRPYWRNQRTGEQSRTDPGAATLSYPTLSYHMKTIILPR